MTWSHLKEHGLVYASLGGAIFGFVLQTEMLQSVAEQGYTSPVFTMLVTHSFMPSMLFLQILINKIMNPSKSLKLHALTHFSEMVHTARTLPSFQTSTLSVYKYLIKVMAILAISVNLAGLSWYVAINLSTASDVTAIYNCSAFFAYIFSIWLLKEQISTIKVISVALSVIGVLIIAYSGGNDESELATSRSFGNMIIAIGTVLYGLYEVLYKKIACTNEGVDPHKQASFANFITALVGLGTIILTPPVLIFCHLTKLEEFKLPQNMALVYFIVSIVGNVIYSLSFLVLMALTNPVLGSISSLLATCCVPFVEYIFKNHQILSSELIGGLIILVAFALMAHASKID